MFQLMPALVPQASAGTLSSTFVLFNSMQTSSLTGGTVCAKPASSGTIANVAVTFPTGYVLQSYTSWTTTTTPTSAWPSGATAWLGIGNA
ncbi:MAG TPA: hypothetical protein VFN31_02695, partial [Candidatus Saccharimonadales bacterium]|nr:hypothetical protein [Candidatus Saccharimonadales bacterium]